MSHERSGLPPDRRIDSATLADLISDALPDAERERVLDLLVDSPDHREALLLSMRSEEDDAYVARLPAASGRPIKPRLHRFYRTAGFLATGLAAAVLVFIAPRDGAPELDPSSPLGSGRGSGSLASALGDSAILPAWSLVRGTPGEPLRTGHAWQMGVVFAVAQRAAAMRDLPLLHATRDALARIVEVRPGGSSQALLLRIDSTGATVREESFHETLRVMSGSPEWFNLGIWMESVRQADLTGAMTRPAVRRAAHQRLTELLRTVPASSDADDGRLAALRVTLEGLRERLANDNWSSVEDGAALQRAFVAGGR